MRCRTQHSAARDGGSEQPDDIIELSRPSSRGQRFGDAAPEEKKSGGIARSPRYESDRRGGPRCVLKLRHLAVPHRHGARGIQEQVEIQVRIRLILLGEEALVPPVQIPIQIPEIIARLKKRKLSLFPYVPFVA